MEQHAESIQRPTVRVSLEQTTTTNLETDEEETLIFLLKNDLGKYVLLSHSEYEQLMKLESFLASTNKALNRLELAHNHLEERFEHGQR